MEISVLRAHICDARHQNATPILLERCCPIMYVPAGCIVDNKVRTRVWSVLLLDGKEPTSPTKKEGDKGTELDPEDTRVIEADVKRTR